MSTKEQYEQYDIQEFTPEYLQPAQITDQLVLPGVLPQQLQIEFITLED